MSLFSTLRVPDGIPLGGLSHHPREGELSPGDGHRCVCFASSHLFRVDFVIDAGFIAAVVRAQALLKYWLPVAIWMALIFSASSDAQSGRRSSRFIGPVVRWFFPHISEPALHRVVSVVRKIAHVVEYAVLAGLLWRARWGTSAEGAGGWNWRHGWFALIVSFLYALTDEIHQAFVPNRGPSAGDVLLDTAGAALALCFIWLTFWLRRAKHL